MLQLLRYSSNTAGILGVILCAISGIGRVTGSFYIGGFEATTLFMAGMGLMVFACLVKLEAINQSLPKP